MCPFAYLFDGKAVVEQIYVSHAISSAKGLGKCLESFLDSAGRRRPTLKSASSSLCWEVHGTFDLLDHGGGCFLVFFFPVGYRLVVWCQKTARLGGRMVGSSRKKSSLTVDLRTSRDSGCDKDAVKASKITWRIS
jgi:hypothetical protein